MLEDKIEKVLSILNERQKRLYLAMEAEDIGHGGVLIVSKASNVSRKTIIKGKKELLELKKKDTTQIADEILTVDRIRKEGGGRKDITETNPGLMNKLELMLEPVTRGHPESVLKWTCLSTRTLAAALKKQGHAVSHTKVGELLKEAGFSLQSNAKRLERWYLLLCGSF